LRQRWVAIETEELSQLWSRWVRLDHWFRQSSRGVLNADDKSTRRRVEHLRKPSNAAARAIGSRCAYPMCALGVWQNSRWEAASTCLTLFRFGKWQGNGNSKNVTAAR